LTITFLQYGETLLHLAAMKGHLSIIEFLIENGLTDIDSRDNMGYTPLRRALFNNFFDVSDYLINKGASIESVDLNNLTMIHSASYNGLLPIVKFLVEPSRRTFDSKTCLDENKVSGINTKSLQLFQTSLQK
jgi:ankyrin repeat protein